MLTQQVDNGAAASVNPIYRMLRPTSLAIAGASPDAATMGGAILVNCESFGFSGPIHLISPTRSEINGRPCFKSIDELPQGVDAVILNIPFAAILPAVEACARRGVGSIIVFSSGFAEAGEDGKKQQEKITEICREADMALLGPNCLGFVNYRDNVALTFEPVQPKPLQDRRSVAVIAQSGATASGIRSAMLGRGIAVSLSVATGNEAVISASDIIRFVITERAADAIALYAEQIHDPASFLVTARMARSAGIPIILMHPGRSKRGQAAAQSHTGSMVGDYALMRTTVENEAVIAVNTMDELYDTAALLHRYPVPPQGALGVVTNSGAIRGMTFDFAEDIGLSLADISADTLSSLAKMLPTGMEIDNPIDVGTTGFVNADIFGKATTAMLADPSVGGVLLPMAGGAPAQQRSKADVIIPVALASSKPVAMAITGDDSSLDPEFIAAMQQSETPLFRSTERAMRAFAAAGNYAKALATINDRTPPASELEGFGKAGIKTEYEGKAFLRQIGIHTPEGELASDLQQASEIARNIGFPVVLKVQATTLSHKSDMGGVILNLMDDEALRVGWHQLMVNIGDTPIDGVLVERMSQPGLEMIVGARNHPDWGPSVLVGLGGVLTEALEATTLLPADISHARAIERIMALRGAKLLGPFRGKPARDVSAVADVVIKLAAAMRADVGIEEIDINPLMIFTEGEGAIALDALIITK